MFKVGDAAWVAFSSGLCKNVVIEAIRLNGPKWYKFGETWLPSDHFFATMEEAAVAARELFTCAALAAGYKGI